LLFCFVWGILRGIFWLWIPWDPFPELVLQGLSLNIQISTFSFLTLYFAGLVYRKGKPDYERYYKTRAIIAYVIVNFIFLLIMLGVIVAAHKLGAANEPLQMGFMAFVAFMYLLLSVSLAIYGIRLFKLVKNVKLQVPFITGKKSMVIATAIMILLFLSRSVRDAVAAANIGLLSLEDPTAPVKIQLLLFFLYFAWEIIPTGFVIYLFWRIPKTNLPGKKKKGDTQYLGTSLFHPTRDAPPLKETADIFNNPTRYDSDEESESDDLLKKSRFNSWQTYPKPPLLGKGPFSGYPTASPLNENRESSTTINMPDH